MIPFCQDEISTRPEGTGFTLGLHEEINFHLIFPIDVLINFFIPLRRAEAIAWENFVPAVQKRDPALPG